MLRIVTALLQAVSLPTCMYCFVNTTASTVQFSWPATSENFSSLPKKSGDVTIFSVNQNLVWIMSFLPMYLAYVAKKSWFVLVIFLNCWVSVNESPKIRSKIEKKILSHSENVVWKIYFADQFWSKKFDCCIFFAALQQSFQ